MNEMTLSRKALVSMLDSMRITATPKQFNEMLATNQLNNIQPWILNNLTKNEYTYKELEEIFTPVFEQQGLKWNKKTSIKYYFPTFTKKQKVKNKIKDLYYIFNIF